MKLISDWIEATSADHIKTYRISYISLIPARHPTTACAPDVDEEVAATNPCLNIKYHLGSQTSEDAQTRRRQMIH